MTSESISTTVPVQLLLSHTLSFSKVHENCRAQNDSNYLRLDEKSLGYHFHKLHTEKSFIRYGR
ncbi:hypothetical protein N7540_000572 [Penicillium herquei]|nr:hypothetical protein N7540_000572 [Penicillium herquei]